MRIYLELHDDDQYGPKCLYDDTRFITFENILFFFQTDQRLPGVHQCTPFPVVQVIPCRGFGVGTAFIFFHTKLIIRS